MLLDEKASPVLEDNRGKSLLYYAVLGRHTGVVDVLEKLLRTDTAIAQILEGALCEAAEAARFEIVESLVDENVNINGPVSGLSALVRACQSGHTDMVQLLLRRGED